MQIKNWSKYLLGMFIIIGGLIGTAIIAPKFSLNKDTGALVGILIGFVCSLMVPNLWKSFLKTLNEDREKAVKEDRSLSFREYLVHPTQLPMTFGILWFICFAAMSLLFQLKFPEELFILIWLLPALFSFGISGLIMIIRKEYIKGGVFGYVIIRGNWSVFFGFLGFIFGIGSGILLLLATIFHW